MRAVIYASSGDDRGSLAGQLDMGRAYAQEHGYTVLAELAEDWVSGATMDAPELQRALDMAQTGAYDVLIVREMDRLARDLVKQMLVEENLHKAGVVIEYVLGEYPATPEGTFNKQIRAVVAEYERQKITERSVRGRRAASRAGRVLGGRAPYGYQFSEDHLHLEIADSEANVIRMIYTWYTDGDGDGPMSSLRIAAKLTAMHIPTWADLHDGVHKTTPWGTWEQRRVIAILHNETYAGKFYYGRCNDGERNPSENWITVEVPAIITAETWTAAQWQCNRNRTCPIPQIQHHYLLQGHVTCGECGGTVYAITETQEAPKYYQYYRCGRRIKGGACALPGFQVAAVDTYAWDWITAMLLDPESLQAGLSGIQNNPLWDEPMKRNYTEFQDKQVAYEAQLARLLDLYLTGNIEKQIYLERKAAIDGDLQRAIKALRDIESACEQAEPLTEGEIQDIITFTQAIAEELQHADFPTMRRIIAALNIHAILYEDRHADISMGLWGRGRQYNTSANARKLEPLSTYQNGPDRRGRGCRSYRASPSDYSTKRSYMINIDLRTTRSYKVTVDSAETLYCILKAAGCHLESYNFISRFSWVPQSSVLKTWDDIQVMDNDSIANIEGVRKAWESEFIFDNNDNLAGIVVPIWHYKDAPHRIYWQLGFGLCYTNPTDVLPDAATHLLDVLQEML